MPKAREVNKKKHRAFLVLLGAFGIILFWRGIWTLIDELPILQIPLISTLLGVILLVVSHQWYREL